MVNGPEFITHITNDWSKMHEIDFKYTQSGKPMQNRYVERFYSFFGEDILDAYYFNDIYQLQKTSDNWKENYNFNHPHKSFIKSDLNNNYLSNLKVS